MSDDDCNVVASALEAARLGELAQPIEIAPGDVKQRVLPRDWMAVEIDGEKYLPGPRRPKGVVKVRTAAGFIAAVQQRWIEPGDNQAVIYADQTTNSLVCVLNDDFGATAGWRDYRVELALEKTDEWQHWSGNEGLKSQETFAKIIEDGLDEIQSPSPAEMLQLAQTFEATVGVIFKQGADLRAGGRQLVYEEDVQAKAGKGGSLEIPAEFLLAIAPYVGGDKYEQPARLKFKIRDNKLAIGYELVRPEVRVLDAFLGIAKTVADALTLETVEGVAPSPRS